MGFQKRHARLTPLLANEPPSTRGEMDQSTQLGPGGLTINIRAYISASSAGSRRIGVLPDRPLGFFFGQTWSDYDYNLFVVLQLDTLPCRGNQTYF